MDTRIRLRTAALGLILLTALWIPPAQARVDDVEMCLAQTKSDTTAKDRMPSKGHQKIMLETILGAEVTGIVLYASDSVLVLANSEEMSDWDAAMRNPTTLHYSEIEEIRVRVKGSTVGGVFKGMGYGVLIGGGIGAVAGLAAGDDQSGFIRFSAEDKALVGLVALGVPGALIGGLAGASGWHNSWLFVGGDLQAYQKIVPTLRRLAVFSDREAYDTYFQSHIAQGKNY
jgi:hypothetical protein